MKNTTRKHPLGVMTPAAYQSIRESLGLTRIDLAQRLGLPRATICDREHGRQVINMETALAIRALLRLSKSSTEWEYAGVDWSMKDVDIAAQIGRSQATVGRMRKRCAEPAHQSQRAVRRPRGFYNDVDWSRPNIELAEDLGVTPNAVRSARRVHAPGTSGRSLSAEEKCANADWSRSDRDLAKELGIGRSYVNRLRRERAPGTLRGGRGPNIPMKKRFAGVDWSRRNKDIAAELGVDASYVSEARKKLAPQTLRRRRAPQTVKHAATAR